MLLAVAGVVALFLIPGVPRAWALAAAVVASAPLSVAAILDIGRRTAHTDPIEAMRAIKSFESYRRAVDSEDAQEGSLSFAEKRSPVWKGR